MSKITDPDVLTLASYSAILQKDYAEEGAEWIGSPFAWIKTRPSRQIGVIGEKLVSGGRCQARETQPPRKYLSRGLPWRLTPARARHPFRARKASLVQGARQSLASAHSPGSWEGVGGFAKEAGHSSFFDSSPDFPIHTSAGGRRTRGGRENRSGWAA